MKNGDSIEVLRSSVPRSGFSRQRRAYSFCAAILMVCLRVFVVVVGEFVDVKRWRG